MATDSKKSKISHPHKVLFPGTGLTKQGLADYYRQVARLMLPHVVDRPLSLVRCPEGVEEGCFYQRHPAGGLLPGARDARGVHSVRVRHGEEERTWVSVSDLDGLLALAQSAALEIHPWGSRCDDLERPDRLVFDLDPGSGVVLERTIQATQNLRVMLEDLGLTCYVKTTGGKGFHVLAPLSRRPGWKELREFSRAVAEELAARQPKEYVSVASKARRPGRIFIDWLRNARGASSIAPYSTRAKPGAPVSAPLAWEELDTPVSPDAFDVQAALRRVADLRTDPWEGFFTRRQGLTPAMWRALDRKKPAD